MEQLSVETGWGCVALFKPCGGHHLLMTLHYKCPHYYILHMPFFNSFINFRVSTSIDLPSRFNYEPYNR